MRSAYVLGLTAMASLALHAVLLWVLRSVTQLPEVSFEIELQSELELGVFDSAQKVPSAPNEAVSAASTSASPPPAPAVNESAAKPAQRDRPNPQKPHDGAINKVAEVGLGTLGALAPRGALLALRVDLDRLRETPLASDAAELLRALPDVQYVLDGSEIDPLQDLSRLLVAAPDLHRAHAVIAGRYHGDDGVPKRAVANLAQARGASPDWRNLRGIQVASWRNSDDTARVLALLGPSTFAITREEDLGRVLAIARALSARLRLGDTAQALVHMEEGELLSLSIEDARSFVRGPRAQQLPERLAVSARLTTNAHLDVRAHGHFSVDHEAEAAEQFWTALRDRYANHPLLALIGFADLIRGCTLTRRGTELDVAASVPITQARLLLGFARDALARPRPAGASSQAAKPVGR